MRSWLVALVVIAACDHPWNPSVDCGRTGVPCSELSDCCSFACSGFGNCECAGEGVFCKIDAACCAGLVCQNEQCVAGCRGNGLTCSENFECCSDVCEGGLCVDVPRCNVAGESCGTAVDCCDGLGCINDKCSAACGDAGVACSGPTCCSGLTCTGGTCVTACGGQGHTCTDPSECCTGFDCRNGSCFKCGDKFALCAGPADCCAGYQCDATGHCTCTDNSGSCATDADCCSGYCWAGISCQCAELGHSCIRDDQCCNGMACRDGVCHPSTCEQDTYSCLDSSDCCGGGCDAMHCCSASTKACMPGYDTCCNGLFCDVSQCAQCHGPGGACDSAYPKQCCSPYDCRNGSTCCQPPTGACNVDVDCCTYERCTPQHACCAIEGLVCANNGDCCSGICGPQGNINICKCIPLGSATTCSDSQDCCNSGQCTNGTCCLPSNFSCVVDSDCCSGTCRTNNHFCM